MLTTDLPSAGADALWHIVRRFKADVFADSSGTLLHLGAEELDADLYRRSGFERVLCTHHLAHVVERLRDAAPPTPATRVWALDLASAESVVPLLGLVARQGITCVYWRLELAADVGAVARALLTGLTHDALVYVTTTDAQMVRQLVLRNEATTSKTTVFLPDDSRRPLPTHEVDDVVRAFEAARYRLIHRETASELAERLGSNVLPLDRLCTSVQVFLAFSPPFRG